MVRRRRREGRFQKGQGQMNHVDQKEDTCNE